MRVAPVCLLLAIGLVQSSASANPSPDERDRQESMLHFNAGNDAFSRGETHEAYREYLAAWRLYRAFDVACNLGRAEAELGKLSDAATHLAYCLDNFSASPQPELRAARLKYRELYRTVTAQVSKLEIEVEPDGAQVFMDGQKIGVAPLGRSLYVVPGQHSIQAHLPGYRDLERPVPATAGETRELRLSLVPLEPEPLPSAAAGAEDPAQPGDVAGEAPRFDAHRVVLLAGSALTLAGAGFGVGFYIQGAKLSDEATMLRTEIRQSDPDQDNPCSRNGDPACPRLADTIERRDRAWNISAAGFVTMGAAGLGTLAAWLWWPEDEGTVANPHSGSRGRVAEFAVYPMLDGRQFGASATGRF